MGKELNLDDAKYFRWGYIPDGRFCDEVIIKAMDAFPKPTIYPSWRWCSSNHFLKNNGWQGPVLWATSAGNHTLFINGNHAFRVWTETQKTCIVDISDQLRDGTEEEIPESCYRKCRPLNYRIHLQNVQQAEQLFNKVKQVYGV